jgi:hypothetical protein
MNTEIKLPIFVPQDVIDRNRQFGNLLKGILSSNATFERFLFLIWKRFGAELPYSRWSQYSTT